MTKRDASRAEQVRRRRNQRSVREMEQTTKRALTPMVRVTSRTKVTPIVIAPKEKERRRRFNIALGLPEIHLKKPKFSMPRIRANWRLASFIIAILLGTALTLAFMHPYFYVPSATVVGNNRITSDEINGVLGIAGKSVFTLQPKEMERLLRLNYPELTAANVEISLPNIVHITVVERQPVILWQQNGGFTWIDTTGVAFRPRGSADGMIVVNALDAAPAGLPSNDPYSPPAFVSQELVDAIRALAPLVPANTTMTFTTADGLGWVDPRGWRVAFGTSAQDMPLKMRVYQSLIDSLTQRGKTPVFISVVHPDGPFYRMAESSLEETSEENQ